MPPSRGVRGVALTGLMASARPTKGGFGGRAHLSRPRLCARNGRYAEDKRFFPDELGGVPPPPHSGVTPPPSPRRYAEDKRFFPDELPRTLAAVDTLWLGYSERDKLGDVTW